MATILYVAMFIPVSSFVVRESVLNGGTDRALFGTIKDSNVADFPEDKVLISKPAIHWTVPGFKIGWKDNNGNWHDEDGQRDGPPMNYWRQSADEREYNEAMDVVDAILAECDFESKITNLERKNSARRPSLSRKILGQWAPLLLSNKCVAHAKNMVEGKIEVPFIMGISRSNGRKIGPRNRYGVFDKMLENGEELTISTLGGNTSVKVKAIASELNEPVDIGRLDQEVIKFGGITCIEDYVMIQRSPGGLIDFFLRVDESYLGISDEELANYI